MFLLGLKYQGHSYSFNKNEFRIIQNLQRSPKPQTKKWKIIFFQYDADCLSAKAELLLLKLIHLFAREVLLGKMLEIEETKTTYLVFNF